MKASATLRIESSHFPSECDGNNVFASSTSDVDASSSNDSVATVAQLAPHTVIACDMSARSIYERGTSVNIIQLAKANLAVNCTDSVIQNIHISEYDTVEGSDDTSIISLSANSFSSNFDTALPNVPSGMAPATISSSKPSELASSQLGCQNATKVSPDPLLARYHKENGIHFSSSPVILASSSNGTYQQSTHQTPESFVTHGYSNCNTHMQTVTGLHSKPANPSSLSNLPCQNATKVSPHPTPLLMSVCLCACAFYIKCRIPHAHWDRSFIKSCSTCIFIKCLVSAIYKPNL